MWRKAGVYRAGAGTTIALAVGLMLVAVLLVVTLSGSPVAVIGANSTVANGTLAETTSEARACQAGEALPAHTSAIRLTLTAEVGPRVGVDVLSGAHVLTSGAVGSGWTGGSVTVPVKPVTHASPHVRVCFTSAPSAEAVGLVGSPTSPTLAAKSGGGEALPGRIKIEYLHANDASWWSMAQQVARRMGLGHAPSGTWGALLLIALMGAVVAGASWLVLEELR